MPDQGSEYDTTKLLTALAARAGGLKVGERLETLALTDGLIQSFVAVVRQIPTDESVVPATAFDPRVD